jgi:hypothetical protein
MPADFIRKHMAKCAEVLAVQEKKWANIYRYKVGNGIRTVNIELKSHVPSHIHIDGHRALISYIGQPVTCYVCNETTHMAQKCPTRKQKRPEDKRRTKNTWAQIIDTRLKVNTNQGPMPRMEEAHQINTNNEQTKELKIRKNCRKTNVQTESQEQEKDDTPTTINYTTTHTTTEVDYIEDKMDTTEIQAEGRGKETRK